MLRHLGSVRARRVQNRIPTVAALALAGAGCDSSPRAPTAVSVDYGVVYQTIAGFGAAGAYDEADLAAFAAANPAIYDDLFGTPATGAGLGLDFFRIKNTYGHPDDATLPAVGAIVAAAKARNPALETMLVAWSPPAALKSNGDINNGGTLVSTAAGYDYAGYGAWWADSLTVGWAGVGVIPDYISIQNEPDALTQYESCLFSPAEGATYAGYGSALEAVRDAIAARVPAELSAMPRIIGPESMGYGAGASAVSAGRGARDYIDHLSATAKDALYAYSFHPYADGGGGGPGYDHPDNHLAGMRSFVADARYNDKPRFMTEYIRLSQDPTFDHAVKLAWHVHDFVVEMQVAAYVHWSLFRSAANSTGGLVNFDPAAGTYAFRDMYFFLKHYSYFTDPGWQVVSASNNSDNLRVTAFKDPDGHRLTVVILNKSSDTETFPLTLTGFLPASAQVFRSSATEHWAPQEPFVPGADMSVPPLSIVTLAFADG
jgi:O-glycosyl hydrolase